MLDTAFAGKFCVIEKRHSFRCFSICSVMLNQLCNHNRVLGKLMLPKCALGKYMVQNMIYWADTESRSSHKIRGIWKVYGSVGGNFISIASTWQRNSIHFAYLSAYTLQGIKRKTKTFTIRKEPNAQSITTRQYQGHWPVIWKRKLERMQHEQIVFAFYL